MKVGTRNPHIVMKRLRLWLRTAKSCMLNSRHKQAKSAQPKESKHLHLLVSLAMGTPPQLRVCWNGPEARIGCWGCVGMCYRGYAPDFGRDAPSKRCRKKPSSSITRTITIIILNLVDERVPACRAWAEYPGCKFQYKRC